MNPATEEKKKNSPLNRKFLLSALAICVFLFLLLFAGIQAYKQSRYYAYLSLREQNYQSDYTLYYFDSSSGSVLSQVFSEDEIWQTAADCLKNFACDVTYSDENYLPAQIHFAGASQYFLQMIIDCNAIPAQDELLATELLQRRCQEKGFEAIINNE